MGWVATMGKCLHILERGSGSGRGGSRIDIGCKGVQGFGERGIDVG